MYASQMETNMQKIQLNMNKFSENLTSVQNGTSNFDDIKHAVEEVKDNLYSIYIEINTLHPPSNLITLHNTVQDGCNSYILGIIEFLKYYGDGDDEHFITGGRKIQRGTELMYKAADMF